MNESIREIWAGQLWTPDGWLNDQAIKIEQGRITTLHPIPEKAPTPEVLNARKDIVIPGLVDLQVNGALNYSFQATDQAHYEDALAYHLNAGTTTLLPTLVTASRDTLTESLAWLAGALNVSLPMTLPGIHLEGPFLAPEKSGAHDSHALRNPDVDLTERFLEAAQGRIAVFTLAPELPGAKAVIRHLVAAGVVVAAGHSAARYKDMRKAVDVGLSLVTHAGNATDWPHRAMGSLGFMSSEPGVVGSLMIEPALGGSIIMDGFHFHPALLKPLLALKGVEKLALLSDASTVAGCPPGTYESGGLIVEVHAEGYATSGRGGGWLAGSTITLLDAVQGAVNLAGIDLHTAVAMATLTPARYLNIHDRKGHLNSGADADLLVLGDDLELKQVIAQGQLVL
jgi:N-acetylglucosamine-6-phosphate deacetylase